MCEKRVPLKEKCRNFYRRTLIVFHITISPTSVMINNKENENESALYKKLYHRGSFSEFSYYLLERRMEILIYLDKIGLLSISNAMIIQLIIIFLSYTIFYYTTKKKKLWHMREPTYSASSLESKQSYPWSLPHFTALFFYCF